MRSIVCSRSGRRRRTWRPMCCMVIDIDQFKAVNDSYGHDVGDQVPARRDQEIPCAPGSFPRTGGDEFPGHLPGYHDGGGRRFVPSAFAARVEIKSINVGDQVLRVTISVGVAVRDRTMPDPDVLIKRADEGAYAVAAGAPCCAADRGCIEIALLASVAGERMMV